MHRICHRCHAELPTSAGASGSYSSTDDDQVLFCPRCGAPQILLPDYMRSESAPAAVSSVSTTGNVPPPRPRAIEWPAAIRCAAPVAILTGALSVGGLAFPAASFLNTLCVLAGAGVVLGLYRSRRPLARIDAGVGLRVGLMTGILMLACMGTGLAATGLVERFGVHGLASFDAEVAEQFAGLQARVAEQAQAQTSNQAEAKEVQQKMIGLLESPEVRAGLGLFYLTVMAVFILGLTSLSGAFSGLLQTRRRTLQGRG